MQDRKTKETRYLYVPTSKGMDFEESPAKNRLLGGAAGVAKSHILRWGMNRRALTIPGYSGLMVRRTYGELEKSQLRRLAEEVPKLGGVYYESKHLAEFPNGSIIEAGHLDDKTALSRWLSTEYDDICADEGSTFDPLFLLELSTRARTSKPAVRAAGGARFNVGTNPGGPAWAVLLDLFVTHEPDFEMFPALKKIYRPEQWAYIKGLLDDNPYRDPDYEDSLAVLGEARYEQLRWGAEFITDGQFFRQWKAEVDGKPWHVVPTEAFGDLRKVEWFCSMDWGYNAPGVILWWACLPDGHYHIAREWKFRETPAEEIQATFWKITNEELGLKTVRYVVCDPAMKAKTGAGRGESIFETLSRPAKGRKAMPMRAGDNDRANGWARCHLLLRKAPDGRPWVTISPECRYGARSMPAQVQDPHDAEDLDTTKDDHWADGFRYGGMSRPSPTRIVSDTSYPVGSWGQITAWHNQQDAGAGVLA